MTDSKQCPKCGGDIECENCRSYGIVSSYDENGETDGNEPVCDADEICEYIVGQVGHVDGVNCRYFECKCGHEEKVK